MSSDPEQFPMVESRNTYCPAGGSKAGQYSLKEE